MPDWKLFSADDHVDLPYLPGDLWEKRVPAAYRERVPRLVETTSDWHWEMDGRLLGTPQKKDAVITTSFGHWSTPVEHEGGRWRPTTPELRLADMDRDGVETQVLYGGLTRGFGVKDPDLNTVVTRAYNEWTADFCAAAPERLVGLGWIPTHSVEAAIAEMHNCANIGLKGVQFQAFFAEMPHWDEAWEPLWDAGEETGLPVSFHVGGGQWSTQGERPPGRGVQTTSTTVAPIQLDEVLVSVVMSGILHRHPGLRVVLGESSIGWIPFVLHRMDWEYEVRMNKGRGGDAAVLDMRPSDYYRRQVYATFQSDPVGVKLLDEVGVDNALWASDYPHGDSVWPRSQETVDEEFAGVDEAVARKVTRDNGIKLYLDGK